MALKLTNNTVVITGSANGLGKALATEFLKEGCQMALIDIDLIGLEIFKKSFSQTNPGISIYKADISNEQEIALVCQQIIEQHKNIDILINNAAISISRHFEELELPDFKRLFDVNFWGTVYCSKYFLPVIKKSQRGRIVNIISGFALMGFPGKTAYGSSKSAVMGFTNSLKTELAGTNVKTCLVIPPALDTGLVKNNKHINEDKKAKEAAFLQKNGMAIDKAAQKIIAGLKKDRYRIVIGPMMFWMDLASRFFPSMLHKMIGKRKEGIDFV